MSVKKGKTKRKFTKEFKDEAVKLVLEKGMKQSEVGKVLGLNSAVLVWIGTMKLSHPEAN